eukprot:TRINITY_DN11207_c0_g1_i3.p1 TRINITY_DN11207_c0_g1~~TRINITY_DN11207_c0_g1_i3.p1  ORF type:complete len:217 (+),score=45.45 TRINITY_DN11207_c0_g1_i3:25-651(+)
MAAVPAHHRFLANSLHDRLASSSSGQGLLQSVPSIHLSPQGARRMPARRHLAATAHTETAAAAVPKVDMSTCPKVKSEVDLASFQALDIRVGVITDAQPVPDKEMTEKRGKPTMSRKLLHLTVDIGCEKRSVVSECKYVMDVEDAVGKKVMFVANIPPTEVEGITSHGLLLTGLNFDPTPMPRSFKVILPGLGRLPPGSQLLGAHTPR